MKKIAFISVLILLLATTTVWACWDCYGHSPSKSYTQTKSYMEVQNKYSERLNKLEANLELKQLEIYKLLDNPDSTVGQVTAKENELEAIESEYLLLHDEMKHELSDQGIYPRRNIHHMSQHKQSHMGHDHQARNMYGYGSGGCWQ